MNYSELKEDLSQLIRQKQTLQEQINKLDLQVRSCKEHTFNYLNLKNKITKETNSYLYELLCKISMIGTDERDSLKWGRGKNIVDYDGIEFIYNGIRYTVGYANNWCTGEYLYTEYDNAERNYFDITNEDIETLNELLSKEDLKDIEEFLKKDNRSELEQIALFIFVIQNLMQW